MTNMHKKNLCGCRVHFIFPSLFDLPFCVCIPYPPPLSMEDPTSDGTPPRVTRRGTSQGDHPPPQDFDRGWSSFRGKTSTAGVCMSPSPPPFSSTAFARDILTLALSFCPTLLAAPTPQLPWSTVSGKRRTGKEVFRRE
jgi:hypothetical protein